MITEPPNVFACPPGADFSQQLLDGLGERFGDQQGHVQVFVNTRRMQRRLQDLYDQRPARLMPKIRLITDLARDPAIDLPPHVSALRRRLELSQLVAALIESDRGVAPRSAVFDLSDTLALLLTEMQDEGVGFDQLRNLEVRDQSGYWERSLRFLGVVEKYLGANGEDPPDEAARQRAVIVALISEWANVPPDHPIVVAGSTGSRRTTAMFMQAIAKLPNGAVVLPGFDFDLPDTAWDCLGDPAQGEEHPQFRFASFLSGLEVSARQVTPWAKDARPHSPERNKLVSLALRPAPVTDQWMAEGPAFQGVHDATKGMTLIEAPSPRAEAVAISLAMRQAAEDGKTVALVTPDRTLTRQVTMSLGRWGIEPDISVGQQLTLSAPGRLLLQIAEMTGRQLSGEALLIVLKHPLAATGSVRRDHAYIVRQLELWFRSDGPPFPTIGDLRNWALGGDNSAQREAWVNWVADYVGKVDGSFVAPVADHLSQLLALAQLLVSGPDSGPPVELFNKNAGAEAERLIAELAAEAAYAGELSNADFASLLRTVLSRGEVRDPVRPHPNVMIWGTLEARVQGADLVILGGLNEGVWPETPSPDPWLNREMRIAAGLLVPERRIGLAAHDFQQAICGKEVILARAVRDADAQTVASRWVNRLTNLLNGMSDDGAAALKDIKAKGKNWVSMAEALESPAQTTPPEPRPSPMPPVAARPKSLSITAISALIRDPYAVYAANVLRLRKIDPLRQEPDARLRGNVLHLVMERFVRDGDRTIDALLRIADEVLAHNAPWPTARILWRAALERVADSFLADEARRANWAAPVLLERRGGLSFKDPDFTLIAKADRIDQSESGEYYIYDYKTGSIPSKLQTEQFDKQLLLEALMVEFGAFEDIPPGPVNSVSYIGLGSKPEFRVIPLEPGQTKEIREQLFDLIRQYQLPDQGYTARRAMASWRFDSDFDQLARFGEWDETVPPTPIKVAE